MLESREPELSVDVKVNINCSIADYYVFATFGTKPVGNYSCIGQSNTTVNTLSPGKTGTFSVSTMSVSLETREEVCYIVSLDGGV